MKTELESLSNVKKKISIKVPEADVLAEIDGVYSRLSQQAQIPGFRKGKVPRPILEKKFSGDVEAEVLENLVRRTIIEALKEHKLNAVTMPEITDPKREAGTGFSYTASIEVKPDFEPKNYTGVKVKKGNLEPTKEQINDVFKRIQDGQSVLKNREGATKPVKGDFVAIILQGIDAEGNLTAPTTDEPKEQIYEIGGEILQKDVEKAVLKLSLNESAPVTIQNENANKGKEFHIRVTLKAIKEKILPTLDDAFAKTVGPFETLEALRTRVTDDLKKELEENSRGEMTQQILETLVKAHPIELPPTMVDQELHNMIHNVWMQLDKAGFKEIPEEYSEDKLHKKLEPDAKRRVHEQLLLEAIATKEKIEVSEEEFNKRLAQLAKAARVPVAEFKAHYEKANRLETVRFQILAQKTVDFLLSKAAV